MYLAIIDPAGSTEQIFLEDSEETMTRNLNDSQNIDYYQINVVGQGNVNLNPVNLKGGPRDPGPNTEVAVIEAGGQDIGSAIVAAP